MLEISDKESKSSFLKLFKSFILGIENELGCVQQWKNDCDI
jgi:hypothetical protein